MTVKFACPSCLRVDSNGFSLKATVYPLRRQIMLKGYPARLKAMSMGAALLSICGESGVRICWTFTSDWTKRIKYFTHEIYVELITFIGNNLDW